MHLGSQSCRDLIGGNKTRNFLRSTTEKENSRHIKLPTPEKTIYMSIEQQIPEGVMQFRYPCFRYPAVPEKWETQEEADKLG